MTTPEPNPVLLDEPAPVGIGRRSPRRLAAAGVVAVLGLGAGVFAVTSMNEGGGYDSPEAAVEAFFDAVDDEDAIGLLETVDPGERASLRRAIDGTIKETDRAAITEKVDLDDVQGVELEVTGLTHTTERFTDDLAGVDLTGGTIEGNASLADAPFGRTVRDVLGADLDEDTGTATAVLDGIRVMTIERDGGWYVSATYTAAEAIRLADQPDSPVPSFGAGTPATGADSPEAVVRELAAAIDAVDVEAMIGLTSPTRARALHDYGPMLIEAAGETDPDAISLTDVELTTVPGPDGTALVDVTAYELTFGNEYETTTHRLEDGCLVTTFEYPEYEDEEYPMPDDVWSTNSCDDDDEDAAWPGGFLFGYGFGVNGDSITFVTVEEDGRWFLDPLDSLGEVLVSSLRNQSVEELQSVAYFWTGSSWLMQPDEFWEACGVERPEPSAGPEAGYDALDQCVANLPMDYDNWINVSGSGYSPSFGAQEEYSADFGDEFSTQTTMVCGPPDAGTCGDFAEFDACFELDDPEVIEACVAELAEDPSGG